VSPGSTEPLVPSGDAPVAFPTSDRYACVAMIGQGGAGVVFRAIDREHRHEVALKVLRTRRHGAVSRLKAEFRARADLHHPNLLQLFELVVTADQAFFTMELVDAVDFLEWIWRPDGAEVASDEAAGRRLAAAMRDVVSALVALHAAGMVHFDVKPGNILIDRTGRARLADFGLSTAFRSQQGAPARDVEGAGTPDYMAPERRRGGIITPASDLYSVGVTILEALTGSPWDHSDDRRDDAAPPLIGLARRLMARDPLVRPTAMQALETLQAIDGAGPPATELEGLAPRAHAEPLFVGRAAPLEALLATLDRVDAAATAAIHVHGPSGIGKTALVRRFLDAVQARRPEAMILRGRCHPYEQIAFGGLDRVVDDLSAYVRDATVSCEGIAPRGLAALVRLFPSLPSRVDPTVIATAEADSALRGLAFAALRDLLVRAAAARPLVIWIDDLQWVDDDTLEALQALQQIPRATFVFTYRLDDTGTGSRLDVLSPAPAADLALRSYRTDLPLGLLDAAELEALVRALAPEISPRACQELAAAAGGYPIFAHVLGRQESRYLDAAELTHPGALSLLLNRMIDRLPAAQRALFDAITVAPGPIAIAIVMQAAATDQALASLRALEQLGVVSRSPGRGAMRVMPFHDRLRHARLQVLGTADRVRIHRELARCHERLASPDFEALAHHYHELAEDGRAGHYAVLAGDRASASLAFGAAASYYARAIEWLPERGEPWVLYQKLAECQANRGHGEDAGAHFELAAAARARIEGPTTATTRLQLRAAEQTLQSGRIPEGYRIMRGVLSALGVRLPRSHRSAILHSAILRARLILRGAGFTPRGATSPDDSLRMDALWMASTSLAHINYPLADVLLLHHVRAALSAGDPSRILCSLTYEAAAEATLGTRYFDRRADALMAQAERLLASHGDDYHTGWYHASCAAVGFFRADWSATIAHAEAAERDLQRHGIGIAWERAVTHAYWLFALALTGRTAGLEERRRIALEDALARRDRLAESHCRSGYTSLVWLFRDDLAGARAERATMLGASAWHPHDAAAATRWPEHSFGTPDYHALLADTHLALYAGDAAEAHARIEAAWPLIRRALLLRIQFVGVDLRFLRARCALAASYAMPDGRAARRIAEHELGRIRRDASAAAPPYHALLHGLLRRTPALLEAAARGFDRLAMAAHGAAARFRLGELAGGAEADRLCSLACAQLSAAGAVRPAQIIQMFAPAPA
jgi:eukaryotic-like serine/threonine-protein kinase